MSDSVASLGDQIRDLATSWATSQQGLVRLAADFADGDQWVVEGSPSAAHWIAAVADIEVSTAREWIRVGKALRELAATAEAFAIGQLSYSKVRALTRVATPDNEDELLGIALGVPAGALGQALATWVARGIDGDELERRHQQQRSVKWWVEPDGMITFSLRLPPFTARLLITWLTRWVMTQHGGARRHGPLRDASADASPHPTVAQQHADALSALLEDRTNAQTEVVLHVRGDGCTFDDGTPIAESAVAAKLPDSLIRALIHDADRRPVNASGRRRHPSTRQKRVVKERDQVCIDCGRGDLLQYDHNPSFDETKTTSIEQLELRCAPCHRARHRAG